MALPGETADARLVAGVAVGDDDVFATLYRRHLPLVVRWCLRETGNRELAADLAAEVFAASLVASRRYRADQGPVSGWLIGIARNKLRERRRRRRVEDSARRRIGVSPIAITETDLERVDELASLDPELVALVDGVPGDQREVLLRRVVDERSYEEIAGSCAARSRSSASASAVA